MPSSKLPELAIHTLVPLIIFVTRSTGAAIVVSKPCQSHNYHALQPLLQQWKKQLGPFTLALGILVHANSCSAEEYVQWQLGNGEVQLMDPLHFGSGRLQLLARPRLLGSGGGGAAFAFLDLYDKDVLVKVSWLRSAESVEKECHVLQVLEKKKVQGVERCLGKKGYPGDKRRVMIAMEPVLENSVAAISEIRGELQPHAVHCIVRTLIQMLAANVATTDVQPLISVSTGDVLFIDMTEAKIMSQEKPLPFLDIALTSSFCVEMLALIPDSMWEVASSSMLQELQALELRGASLSDEAYNVLQSQTQFMPQEALDFIDAKIGSLGGI